MKKRILIVDDSELVHDMYGALLEDGGFEVLHAKDGFEAINATFTEMPDLVLLDIQMPVINGYQVCRLVKDHPLTRDIPVVLVTANQQGSRVADPQKWSFQTGADGYLEKGNEEKLLEFLRPFLEPARRSGPPRERQVTAMSKLEILTALSSLLDKQLYLDVSRLKELDEKKNGFVANVSHEFKSPLTIIKGNLDMIKRGVCGPVTDDQTRFLGSAIKAIDRINRLVSDLLDLAQIEAGKLKMDLVEVQVQTLISEMVDFYQSAIDANGQVVTVTCTARQPVVRADHDRLSQSLINIFNNSLKYTPKGGRIDVRIREDGASLLIDIADDGPGIAPEELGRLFDKFERILTERYEGTGLGLCIAQDMIRLHQGTISVSSTVGKGTTFTVQLPKIPSAA